MKSVSNKIVRIAPGTSGVSSFNGRVGAVSPASNDYTINQIQNASELANSANTDIINPTNGQALYYNGSKWYNETPPSFPVNSVFGRTGTITAQANDYTISQIQNASALANSSNVVINLPAVNQYIKYNGLQWVNDNASFYLSNDSYVNTTFTPYLQSINFAPGSTATMPNCGLGDVGKRILFLTGNGQNVSIFFPLGIQLYEVDGGHSNFTMFSSYGTIEFAVSGSNIYSIVSCTGAFLNPANNKALNTRNLDALYDTNLTSLSVNDYISYNGTQWVNTKHKMYIYLNSNANLSNNQYLQQTGQTGTLGRGKFTFPKAGVISKIHITLDVAPGGLGTRVFTVIVEGVASTMTGTISGTSRNLDITTNNVNFSAGNYIALLHTTTGFPNASVAYAYIEYYFTTL